MNNKILNIMASLRNDNPELKKYKGFGYCGYGSELLKRELLKINIKSNLLVCDKLDSTTAGELSKAALTKTILSIDINDPNKDLLDIKHGLQIRGRMPLNTGHAVVCVGNVIYDITSGQFGLPETYSLKELSDIWVTINHGEISIGNPKEKFGIVKIIRKDLIK